MPVFIQIPENPNCEPVDGQVFSCQSQSRTVSHIRHRRNGRERWTAVTGLNTEGQPCAAMACLVEDSGDGRCYLITGGDWGLRFKDSDGAWDLTDSEQWGEAFLLLGGDGNDIRFAS